MGSKLSIWGLDIPELVLLHSEKQYLESLPKSLPTMNWVCEELDRVWDEYNLDNSKPLVSQAIGSYYSHPVWLMNGIFSARDITSVLHRQAIAKYLQSLHVSMVADYGGGFGERSAV